MFTEVHFRHWRSGLNIAQGIDRHGHLWVTDIFNASYFHKIVDIFYSNFVSKDPNDDKSALAGVMTCRRIVDKPLSQTMGSQFIDKLMMPQQVSVLQHHYNDVI